MLNDTDRRILRQMQADPDLPLTDLARRAALTPATLSRRLERMREAGVLTGKRAEIHWPALGYAVEVSLRVTLDKTQPRAFDDFLAEARKVPEVTELQTFLGQTDVRVAVIARDIPHYQEIYRERILSLPHIADIEALMHVARIKDDETYPV